MSEDTVGVNRRIQTAIRPNSLWASDKWRARRHQPDFTKATSDLVLGFTDDQAGMTALTVGFVGTCVCGDRHRFWQATGGAEWLRLLPYANGARVDEWWLNELAGWDRGMRSRVRRLAEVV